VKVLQNRVPRKISGGFKLRIVKQGDFRKLCDEKNEMGSGTFGTLLLRKSEGKGPFGRPKRKWEEYVKIEVKGIGCGSGTGLIWHRIETSVIFPW
jgi:hypothetical protein